MTRRDEVIRMMREAGAEVRDIQGGVTVGIQECRIADFLERFADLVAAAEREQCAKACETYAVYMRSGKGRTDSQLTDRLLEQHGRTGDDLAATIRARGTS